MASKRKYKTKKVPVNVLRESNGKVVTEHLFLRDMKMVRFFMDYMKKNINYLKRYESDPSTYDLLESEISSLFDNLDDIEDRFKEHVNKEMEN